MKITEARKSVARFEYLRAMGRNAALDMDSTGELILRTTRPGDDVREWGRGALPMAAPGSARMIECVGGMNVYVVGDQL